MIITYIFIFALLIMFFLSRFLGRANLLVLPYFFICIGLITYMYEFKDFLLPILLGSIFFYFLGVVVKRYHIDTFLEMLFQVLIISSIVFLGMKIYFIRKFTGGFYYFTEIKAILFTFFWIFINMNVMKFIKKTGELFLGIGVCIVMALYMLIINQNMPVEVMLFAQSVFFIYLWLLLYKLVYRESLFDESIFYFLSFLTVSLSIVGTAKSVMIFSVIIPAFIVGIPLLFILFMTILSFIRFQKGVRDRFSWKFTYNRMIFFLYLITFYVTIPVILYFSRISLAKNILVSLLSFSILYLIGRSVFFGEKKSKVRKRIFGVDIKAASRIKLLKSVHNVIRGNVQNYIVTLNALMLYEAKQDDFYRVVLNSADFQTVDGVGVLWAMDFLGYENMEKVTGIDFVKDLAKLSAKHGYGIFMLGAKQDVVDSAAKNMKRDFEGIVISGTRNGYFNSENETEVIDKINRSGAKILLVGMGVPRQEKWIFYNLHKLPNVRIAIGVGGTFDVLSGKVKRAPGLFQKVGLEWLYRTLKEPTRFGRILKLPAFVLNVFREYL